MTYGEPADRDRSSRHSRHGHREDSDAIHVAGGKVSHPHLAPATVTITRTVWNAGENPGEIELPKTADPR